MASYNIVAGYNILVADSVASTPNFGTIGLVAYHGNGTDRLVYEMTNDGLAAMVLDGFALTSSVYKIAAAIKAQLPHVKELKVFNRAAPNEQEYTLTPTNTDEGAKYEFSANGIDIAHTNGAAETIATICAALTAQLDDLPNATATDGTTSVGLELTDPEGERLYIKGAPRWLTIKDVSTDAGIADDIADAVALDDDFYGLLIDSMSEPEILAAAAAAETYGKLAHFLTVDSDAVDSGSTDVGSDMKAAGYTFSGVFYTRDPGGRFDAALMGRMFAINPGGTNWENQTLASLTAYDLTGAERANALSKNVGLFLPVGASLRLTHGIKAASGRWFDISRDRDWHGAMAQARLVSMFANNEKVPANQTGIDMVDAELRAQFMASEAAGVLDPGWTLTLPTAAEVPTLKATRRLVANDVSSGSFTGSINGADVSGSLSAV